MDKLLSGIAILVVLVLVGVSAFMNYEYFIRWGNTPSSKIVLGVLTVCIDILKSLTLVFIVWAWRNKNYTYVAFASIFFPFFILASVASGMGFLATNKDNIATQQTTISDKLKEAKAEIKRQRAKLAEQPKARAGGIIRQNLNTAMLHKRFNSSKQCTEATAAKSISFCRTYFKLKAEQETARARAVIETKIATLVASKEALLTQGANRKIDPQADLIASITGQNLDTVQKSINFFISALLEMATAFGLFLATGHGGATKTAKKKKRTKTISRKAILKEIPQTTATKPQTVPLQAANNENTHSPMAALLQQDLRIVAS